MSDIVTSRIFVDGEKGITAAKLNDIVASSVIQPAFYTSKPTASTADPTDVILLLKSGAYAQMPMSTVTSAIDASQIWSVRLRSFNAIGNPNFEVDQRNIGNVVATPATGTLIQDRWAIQKAGTLIASSGQQLAAANEVLLPGTNFAISGNFHRITLTTAQTSLGASDNLTLYTQLEGPQFRELQYDVHSMSVLVRSNVAGLKFGLSICDPATTTKSLTKLGTIAADNTWTLLMFPNLPVFPSGNFSSAPGSLGYLLNICLSAGATLTSPANDIWQNGSFIGATGQSNFAAGPLGSTFDVAFVQHEPGPVSSTLMDCPFEDNLRSCGRYFQKSIGYGSMIGSGALAFSNFTQVSTGQAVGEIALVPHMAKVPTCIPYNAANWAVNQCYMHFNGTPFNAALNAGDSRIYALNNSANNFPGGGSSAVGFFWTADTGW